MGLSHDEAVEFYKNMFNDLETELNEARSKENFDEEEFYKERFKGATIENISSI